MSEEITEVKISMPLIDNIELQRIDNFYNDIVSEYTKAFVKEKEQVIIQRLMKNVQQENNQLKDRINKAVEELNNGLSELDKRRREEVYIEQYIEEAIDLLKGDKE